MAADLVAVDAALCDRVARVAGIDRSSLLLAASHTHSGPAGVTHALHPAIEDDVDQELRVRFVETCAAAITKARERRTKAIVHMGRAKTAGFASNRNDADGPYSPDVIVLEARALEGRVIGRAVHWTCHPTILSSANLEISADFPGSLRRSLQQTGDDIPILFLNGAAGDVSTRFTRQGQSWDEVGRVGRALGETVDTARLQTEVILDHFAHATCTVLLAGWTDEAIAETRARLDAIAVSPATGDAAADRIRSTGCARIGDVAGTLGVSLPAEDKIGPARCLATRGRVVAGNSGRADRGAGVSRSGMNARLRSWLSGTPVATPAICPIGVCTRSQPTRRWPVPGERDRERLSRMRRSRWFDRCRARIERLLGAGSDWHRADRDFRTQSPDRR